jgi:hypothetical protein
MGLHSPPVEAMLPLPRVLAISLGSTLAPRSTTESLIASMIETLDQSDGDPDIELNGDDLDGNNAEDDFWDHCGRYGEPGCPISDPGGGDVVDERHDALTDDGL